MSGMTHPESQERPWPVLLLTALGAWLAVVPLLAVVALLFGSALDQGAGTYVVGALLLGAAVVVLRAEGVALFVEQLALPVLLVGGGTLGFGLVRDLPAWLAALGLGLLAFAVALMIGRMWLTRLLGALGGGLLIWAMLDGLIQLLPDRQQASIERLTGRGTLPWLVLHLQVGLWLGLEAGGRRQGLQVRWTQLDPWLTGWWLLLLAYACSVTGRTFLVGGGLGFGAGAGAPWMAADTPWLQALVSVLLAGLAAWQLQQRWPELRRRWCLGVAVVLMLLAAWMPTLGVVLLALAWALGRQRRPLVAAAALAALWIVGSFYYQWQRPLADKALVLMTAALTLGVMARAGLQEQRGAEPSPPGGQGTTGRHARIGLGLSALAVLLLVNVGIWQKEQLIRDGRPVLVELAPVDPRSLMQGDYMALNYHMTPELNHQLDGFDRLGRPRVVLRLDGDGVATLMRLADATQAPGPDELVVELTPKGGSWVLVSDAWFFREGDGERWQAARYGEFRVDASGRALLVGLADAQRQPIRP